MKRRRSRIVPRAIFATVCIGVVPEIGSSFVSCSGVSAMCFSGPGCGGSQPVDAGVADAGPPDAGPPDGGRPDGGHGDGG
jgi:hypothetical protein